MKSTTHISRLSLLTMSLCLGALTACSSEDQDLETGQGAAAAQEGAGGSQEPGLASAPDGSAGSQEVAEQKADDTPMTEAERRRQEFQAKIALLKQSGKKEDPTPLVDAHGHPVDKLGNHIDTSLPPDKQGAVAQGAGAKQIKRPGELVNPPSLGHNNGPRLSFEIGQEKHDFGKLLQGMVAEHEFTLRSSGSESIIIRQVKPTCGCTIAAVYYEGLQGERLAYIYGNEIPADTTIWIPARLHTKGKRGHQNTRINITSTDPRGQTQLGLEADIDPFFVVMPSYLNFGQIRKGEQKTLSLQISTVKNEALAMHVVPSSIPAGVTVDIQPTGALTEEGRSSSWKVTATAGPDLVEGNLARTLMVMSDKVIEGGKPNPDGTPAVFQVSVTLSARVVGPFSFNPPYMSMGLVRPGQVLSRSIRLTCHDVDYDFTEHPPTIQIRGIAPANQPYPDWVHAERFTPRVSPVPGENAVDIELTCQGMPETLSGSFRGTLLVSLDHAEKSEVVIPITGVCRGGVVPVTQGNRPAGVKKN